MPRKSAKSASSATSSPKPAHKTINLALQGGGAHGAFAWGVLDYLLEDGRLSFEGVSGTSAGSMNAVVLVDGLLKGGRDGARAGLENFWHSVSEVGERYSLVRPMPWDRLKGDHWNNDDSLSFQAFKALTNAFSPYQLNPNNFNPLRDILIEQIDFEQINKHKDHELFLSATNVQTGNVRVFHNHEIDVDVVMASACLPFLYQAVEIGRHTYWDGGYMGNPALFPLFYRTAARDVLIIHINPIVREGTPTTPHDIEDRVNEISFNSALIKELRAVAFVQKLVGDGWLKDEFRDQLKYVLIHSLRADHSLSDLSAASKLCTDWSFLQTLRDRGREAAKLWLERHFDDIGVRQTVDLRAQFLNSGSEMQPYKPPKSAKPLKPLMPQMPLVIKGKVPTKKPTKIPAATPVKTPVNKRKSTKLTKTTQSAKSRKKSS